MRSIRVLIVFVAVIGAYSCHKSQKTTTYSYQRPGDFWAFPAAPYDTINLSGIFITSPLGSTAYFYGRPGAQANSSVAVQLNGSSSYYFSGNSFEINGGGDTFSKWNITSTASFSFSYTDSSIPPSFLVLTLPDTVTRSSGTIIPVTVLNADTIMLSLYFSLDTPQIRRYYSIKTDTIRLGPDFFATVHDTQVQITVSALRHKYETINGFRYLFIKEDDVITQIPVWLK